ncbi:MAG: hypothetical protein RRY36_06650 [Bacteroidaceae bacterium]
MKNIKLMIALACASIVGTQAFAQTIYDANNLMHSDLNGTARFVGMGGAMGALGGDISTMGTNPAGIGIYRSNDLMTSFGFNKAGTESEFHKSSSDIGKWSGSFDNIGFVYSNKISNTGALRYVNFGFNYRKKSNFNRNMVMGGDMMTSQTNLFATMAMEGENGMGYLPSQLGADNAFVNDRPYVGWLPILAYQAYLINPQMNEKGEFLGGYTGYAPNAGVLGNYRSEQIGGVNSFDFNIAFNVRDVFYIGATLGLYQVDQTKYTSYGELFTENGSGVGDFMLENNFKTIGNGVDFKLGFIYRPSGLPLRIGASIHTPTYYNLRDKSTVRMNFNTYNPNKDKFESGMIEPYDADGYKLDESVTDYTLTTPWKYNFSLGYTIGKWAAIGAEYEYENRSTAKYRNDSGEALGMENNDIKHMLKGIHTVRAGVEIKVAPQFSVRGGYNHSTAAFKDDAVKSIPYNSIRTDAEYSNIKAINNYTLGLGYRGRVFYADLAYQYSAYKSDFFAFEDIGLDVTKVTNTRNQVLMTLGVRF